MSRRRRAHWWLLQILRSACLTSQHSQTRTCTWRIVKCGYWWYCNDIIVNDDKKKLGRKYYSPLYTRMVIHIHVQSVIIFAITSYLNSKTRGFLSPASRRRRDLKRIAPQTDAWGPFSCAPCDSTNLNSNKVKRSRYSFSISVFFLL